MSMWVRATDGTYVNLDLAERIEPADQGDDVVLLVARFASAVAVIQTQSVLTTVEQAQAAIATITSAVTLTV